MAEKTKIPWAHATYNPWYGCSPVSEGCANCYAEGWIKRTGRPWGEPIRAKDATFYAPLKWKEPRTIFVCSLSDFFHPGADKWRAEAMEVMMKAYWHTFLILTKRIERVPRLPSWATGRSDGNFGLGVTLESQDHIERVTDLTSIPATLRFVSIEPMLGPITVQAVLPGINGVICGCESRGNGLGRECRIEWIRDLRDQCIAAGIPFMLKQMAVGGKLVKMPELDGRVWGQLPEEIGHGDV